MSNTAVASTHKRMIEQANFAFAGNDMDAFLSLCTEDVEWTMVGDSTVKGKRAIREWLKSMDPGTPKIRVDQIVAEDDVAIACGSFVMKDVAYDFCDVYRFKGDRIASLKAYVIKPKDQPQTR
jgi:ketosteroid isomerase-like protein